MSTNRLSVGLQFTPTEVLDESDYPAGAAAGSRTLRGDGFNTQQDLDSTTTPALEAATATMEITLGASAEIIDLTAVEIGIGRDSDMTGKRLLSYVFNAATANTGAITVDAHTTDGYNIFGASGLQVLAPGRRVVSTLYGVASAEVVVASGAKNVRVDGTLGDIIQIGLAFGT